MNPFFTILRSGFEDMVDAFLSNEGSEVDKAVSLLITDHLYNTEHEQDR